ncbi:hypothetical protein VP01_8956g1, partial [Puccinia sorghi]
ADTPLLQVAGNFKKVFTAVNKELKPKRPDVSSLPRAHSSLLNQLHSGHCTLKNFGSSDLPKASEPLLKFLELTNCFPMFFG